MLLISVSLYVPTGNIFYNNRVVIILPNTCVGNWKSAYISIENSHVKINPRLLQDNLNFPKKGTIFIKRTDF